MHMTIAAGTIITITRTSIITGTIITITPMTIAAGTTITITRTSIGISAGRPGAMAPCPRAADMPRIPSFRTADFAFPARRRKMRGGAAAKPGE
jgi:hypothetical protein